MRTPPLTRIFFVEACLFSALHAQTDGQADLQSAIKHLNAQTAFSAEIVAEIKSTNTEGKDQTHKAGTTRFQIHQTDDGLQIHYSKALLEQIDQEAQTRKKDPSAKTPATEAMNRFNYYELSALLYPLRELERDLGKAVFKKEEQTTWQGKPARLLHFNLPMEKLPESERKNLKHYKATIKIWIDENGIPLASHSTGKGTGRIMLVIGFEFHFDVHKTYTTIGNQLLTTDLSHNTGGSGAGMSGDETINAKLSILDTSNR